MATTATVAVTAVAPPSMASAHSFDEEVAKKKNTDCVYFLASPLTCKKGDECEFRHNENARMNPRDCWYWLGGGCRNRECSFRHPPLETRASAPAAPLPSTPVPAKKPVPCYFFSQGCCAKGSKCQFLHETATPNVYRLSDKSPTPVSESSKSKGESTSSDAAQTNQPQQNAAKDQIVDRRKENVYQAHKESYTWKLSDSPAVVTQAQQQPAAEEKKSEKQRKEQHHHERNEKRKSKDVSNARERDRDRERIAGGAEGNELMMANEDFAGPKSLAQIKEEKRKNGDVEDPGSASSKGKRKSTTSESGDQVRRRLCNGGSSSGMRSETKVTAAAEDDGDDGVGGSMEEGGNDDQQKEAEECVDAAADEDDFARKLGGLLERSRRM